MRTRPRQMLAWLHICAHKIFKFMLLKALVQRLLRREWKILRSFRKGILPLLIAKQTQFSSVSLCWKLKYLSFGQIIFAFDSFSILAQCVCVCQSHTHIVHPRKRPRKKSFSVAERCSSVAAVLCAQCGGMRKFFPPFHLQTYFCLRFSWPRQGSHAK